MTAYEKYTDNQLTAMGKIYYAGKATLWQAQKYEFIRSELLDELRTFNPEARDHGTAVYIWFAIKAAVDEINKHEKELQAQARANMQTAHNHMVNYKLSQD